MVKITVVKVSRYVMIVHLQKLVLLPAVIPTKAVLQHIVANTIVPMHIFFVVYDYNLAVG